MILTGVTEQTKEVQARQRVGPHPLLSSNRGWLFALGAYFIIQTLCRTLVSGSVDLDESEQVLFAQALLPGYGPAPLLYTWLQIGFFSVFGHSVLALALLKNLLLFGTYLFIFLAGRRATGERLGGLVAAISLLFIPQVAWESQRDLTHSVLASFFAAALLHVLFLIFETGRVRWYITFGLCAGLGLLSKYNFGLWFFALLLAASTMRQLRPAVLNRRMGLGVALAALVVLPGVLWGITHPELAFRSASKLGLAKAEPWFRSYSQGLAEVLAGLGSVAGPLFLVYVAAFSRLPYSQHPPRPAESMAQKIDGGVYEVFLIRVFVAAICATLLAVAFSRATSFHGRWLQPLLVSIPVLAVSLVRRRLVPTRCNYMAIGGIVIAGALVAAIPGRIVLGARLGREEPLMRPYPELAAQLKKVLPERVLVVADRTLLAGNLRMGLPNVPIVTRETTHLVKSWRGEVVFVWPSKDSATMPPPLQRWALGAGFEWAPGDPQLLSARYKYDPEKSFALAFLKGRTRSAVGRE